MRTGILISLLVVSVACNAYLLYAPSDSAVAASPAQASDSGKSKAANQAPKATANQTAWSLFASDDLPTFVSRLRSAGLSEKEIRALVSAELSQRLRLRKNALMPPNSGEPRWWKSGNSEAQLSWKTRTELNELKREHEAELARLLGPQLPEDENSLPRELRAVSPEKRQALKSIMDDYNAMKESLGAGQSSSTLITASEKQRMEVLDSELKKDLAALCSPEEQSNLEFLRSGQANQLTWMVGDMDLPVSQLRQLGEIQANYEKASGETLSFETHSKRSEEREQQLRSVLGDTQYKELQYASSSESRQLAQSAARAGLPEGTAREVFSLKDQATVQSVRIAEDTSRPVQERIDEIKSIGAATRAQIMAKLGPDLAEAYIKSNFYVKQLEQGNAVRITYNSSTSYQPRTAPTPLPHP